MNCSELNDIEGLKFMPVTAQKRPIIKNWQHSAAIHDLSNCEGVGLVCGELSGGLEVIDCDEKYSLDGLLFDRFKKLVHAADNTLLEKLAVQTTVGKGYHVIYRCSVIAGNQKFANRCTTEAEKQFTYNETYAFALKDPKNKSDEEARIKAQKAKECDKVRVLMESRGEGGYIMCHPSRGYNFINRDFYGIMEITPEQRDILHGCARQLNEVFEEVVVPKTTVIRKTKGLSVFDDYNERGDIIELLQNHGWKVVSNKGSKTHFLRPGQSSAATSGNFDHAMNRFSVFTTSTEFEPNKGYMRYAVFAILECNGNFSEASKRLYELKFGERDDVKEKAPSTRVIQSRVNVDDGDLSFLATGADYDGYLETVIDGTLQMGLTTGSPALDQYFMRKRGGTEGSFVMTNGHDNTGKSVLMFWLQLLAAMYHGWKGVVFASENTIGGFMRKMVQFYWGKPLRGYGAMSRGEYNIAKTFVEKHFHLIKAQEDLYNYKDILNMVKKTIKAYPDLDWAMIDPYNSLKTDLSGFSKLSTHDYHYEALSEMKSFGQVNNFGWVINHHAVTESLRRLDKEGYPVAPNKADTEGGNKVPAKADDFLTIHRKTQHPTDWMITEVHVRKVKDTETGGRPTPLDQPVLFRMNKNGCGFTEELREGGHVVDPVQRWHQTQTASCEEEKHWADRKDYITLEQFREQQTQAPVVPMTILPKDYVPDDEEKEELEKLLLKEKPF